MRAIDGDALYEQLKEEEDKARERVINMPSSYPDGSLNPQAINFLIQLTKIAWFKKVVYEAPTITPERETGKWKRVSADTYTQHAYSIYCCDQCGGSQLGRARFCPNCGAKMEGTE